jgi:hypothetical protein
MTSEHRLVVGHNVQMELGQGLTLRVVGCRRGGHARVHRMLTGENNAEARISECEDSCSAVEM